MIGPGRGRGETDGGQRLGSACGLVSDGEDGTQAIGDENKVLISTHTHSLMAHKSAQLVAK